MPEKLKPNDHLCLIYEPREAWRAVVDKKRVRGLTLPKTDDIMALASEIITHINQNTEL